MGVNPSQWLQRYALCNVWTHLWQIWQVFGPWTSPYGANGQMAMTVHNYRPRQFHRTSNGENPSSGYTKIWVPQVWQPLAHPLARTVMTIPLQPGLRGKNWKHRQHVSHFVWCERFKSAQFCECCPVAALISLQTISVMIINKWICHLWMWAIFFYYWLKI